MDMVHPGVVPMHKRLPLLEESLKNVDTSDHFAICGIIDQFSQQPSLKENNTLNRLEIINKCFSKRIVEEIISALEQEAPNVADGWVTAAIQSLRKASPTSLKISLRSPRTSGSAVGVENPDDTLNRIARGMFGGYVNASVSADGNYSSPLDDDLALF